MITMDEIWIGIMNTGTMLASNNALKFVNFPTQVLTKCTKILPVMIVGIIRGTYSYPMIKYICAVSVTGGLVIFNLAKILSAKPDLNEKDSSLKWIGYALLVVSLTLDGVINTQCDIVKRRSTKKNQVFRFMVSNNLVGIFITVAMLAYEAGQYGTNPFLPLLEWKSMQKFLIFGFAGGIGQIFIYLTIQFFNGFILTSINTSRKFMSMFVSILMFGHQFNLYHKIGVGIIIASTLIDIVTSEMSKRSGSVNQEQKKDGEKKKDQ